MKVSISNVGSGLGRTKIRASELSCRHPIDLIYA